MILFLDFDGVLHPHPTRDERQLFCRRPTFEKVIRDFPHVEIVISSRWRREYNLDQLRAFFSDDVSANIIDVTPELVDLDEPIDVLAKCPRQFEIEGWLRHSGRTRENWVAIDYRPYWFRPFISNLVICDPSVGIDDTVAMSLHRKLRRFS